MFCIFPANTHSVYSFCKTNKVPTFSKTSRLKVENLDITLLNLSVHKGQNEVEDDYNGSDSQWLDLSWLSR